MQFEARVAFQPGTNVFMLMRPIVVHDQMQRHLARELLVERTQETEEFLMSVSLIALAHHLSLQNLQRSE